MQDFLLDINGDLAIDNNDFVVGESNNQHQELLLLIAKAELKEKPEATVGIEDFINETEIDAMVFEVRKVFEADGMIVNKIAYNETTGDLSYDANYKN
jgi:hypothetical protein